MTINPLLTQIRPTYFSVDCGMAYLMRLSDGRFIVIDSTFGEYDEPEHIYDLMCKQNETSDIPRVAAWFFTHPHGDHTHGFIKMSLSHAEKIAVEKVIYDFPTDKYPGTHDHLGFLEAISRFGAETYTPKKGDILKFADACFNVLYTAKDCYVAPVNVNETSLTMRMTLGNYSVMWLGDLQHVGSKIVMETYSPDELKSDILQVGHHGYWGGSDELFRAVDPQIAIWPMPEFRYLDMLAEPYNRFFTDPDNNIQHIFVSGIEENTFDLTKPIEITTPYVPFQKRADFSKKSIYSLGWACITGGIMGYSPVNLTFNSDSCTLTTRKSRALLQFIQRGQVAVSDGYKFDLTLTPQRDCDTLGLIYDCPTPTTPDSYGIYNIPYTYGKEVSVSLTINRKNGTAFIDVDGKAENLPLRSKEPCDIILILNDAEITVNNVMFKNI